MSYNPYAYAGSPSEAVTDRFARGTPQAQPQQPQQQTHQGYPPQGAAPGQQHQGYPPQQFSNQGYAPQGNAPGQGQNNGGAQQAQGFPFQDPRNTMAFQLGQSAFSNFIGQDNFNQFQETVTRAAGTSSTLSHYFQVSTMYVVQKVRQILFPFLNTTNWQRTLDSTHAAAGGAGGVAFLPPKDDVNSPDMYIPLMGLVTYILVWNTQQGLQGSFNPENLYYKLSSILAFVGLDLSILKLGLYLLVNTSSPTTSITELLCYVGYKFVPLTIALFVPTQPWWVAALGKMYLFSAFGVFLLRSVKFNLFNSSQDEMASVKKSTVKKCNYFLFVYGFVWQSVLMWLMG
ncbi:protein transporter [Maudiozyma humilis]|uniref:Protein YIF1 n=1 Tax=Maudiozyma humilis TaxID=51915 RepID=A0AAV5S4Q2_MAUHU|nr:protein transporter [Kazachstania humilis]